MARRSPPVTMITHWSGGLDAAVRTRRITIVRHGRSAHAAAYKRARLADMPPLLDAYDAAGICATSPPPQEVLNHVASAAVIVASPLARARDSARLATASGDCRDIMIDDLFREVDLPVPPTRGPAIALSPFLWVLILRCAWLVRLLPGAVQSPRAVWARAVTAADRLDRLSVGHGHVVLIGHSLFNYLTGFALLRRGWRGKVRPQAHWQCTMFTGDIRC